MQSLSDSHVEHLQADSFDVEWSSPINRRFSEGTAHLKNCKKAIPRDQMLNSRQRSPFTSSQPSFQKTFHALL